MNKLVLSIICLFLLSCSGSPAEKELVRIRKMEKTAGLKNSDSLIHTCIRFADTYPEHAQTPGLLFKAAEMYIRSGMNAGTDKVIKGARIYERMAFEYATDTLAPEALIRAGIAYSTIPDPANAKRMYDGFIKAYPSHARIGEVRVWSETAGLSEEELLKRFEERFLSTDTIN